MASKDTIQGLTIALQQILRGLDRRYENQRLREREAAYDARAEQDQAWQAERMQMSRESHAREMEGRGQETQQQALARAATLSGANDAARLLAVQRLIQSGFDPTAAASGLEAEQREFKMPPVPGMASSLEELDAFDEAKKKGASMEQAIATLRLLMNATSGSQMAPTAPRDPERLNALLRIKKQLQDLAASAGNPVAEQVAEQQIKSSLPVNGSKLPEMLQGLQDNPFLMQQPR